jgi:hypothetical protein
MALEVRHDGAPGLRHPQSTTDEIEAITLQGAFRLVVRTNSVRPTHGCGTVPGFDRLSSTQRVQL